MTQAVIIGPFTLNQCHTTEALVGLRRLPDECVQCVVTSPPYWGLRSYLPADHTDKAMELGSEPTPEKYVERLVEIFREARRVLRKDGVLWLNLGDSYSSGGRGSSRAHRQKMGNGTALVQALGRKTPTEGFKTKDLVGIPWRVAFALQADGWYLRSDIIWAKSNPMPESVTDRPTKAHEYIFLLTKSARYFYDAEAVREPHADPNVVDGKYRASGGVNLPGWKPDNQGWAGSGGLVMKNRDYNPAGRNLRSVWTIATQPFKEAHFATFPEELARRCILAGTSHKACGVCGAPWERVVEIKREVSTRAGKSFFRGQGQTRPLNRRANNGSRVFEDVVKSTTTGFRPTCDHDDGNGKCLVLDPFIGSGMVGKVCAAQVLAWLGFDLNPEYEAMQKKRTAQAGLFSMDFNGAANAG